MAVVFYTMTHSNGEIEAFARCQPHQDFYPRNPAFTKEITEEDYVIHLVMSR